MGPLEEIVFKKFNYLIKTNDKGKKYVDSEELNNIEELKKEEKSFIRMIFRLNGIAIRNKKITKEDRTSLVKDYNYGDIQGNELEEYDEPVIANIEFEDGNLIFENYEELDKFLEFDFIPNKVKMKINRSGKNLEEKGKRYPSIQLNEIVKLKLSEKENKHIIEYLNNQGIRVAGISQDLDSEFEEYDYTRTYGNTIEQYVKIKYKKQYSSKEMFEKFIEYSNTKNPIIKEELIVRNYRLVPFVAWKLALRHNVDQNDLEGYGYEALIYAVDRYDPYISATFATYAIPYIEGYIKKFIPELKDNKSISSNIYYQFNNAKYIVEKSWGKKYEGEPEMLDEIVDLFIEINGYSVNKKQSFMRAFSKNQSFEEIEEELIEPDIQSDYDVFEEVSYNQLKEIIKEVLETLTEREQKVLELRFGLLDGKERTQKEIGIMFNKSSSRIGQIEQRALRKLRHPERTKLIKDFLGDNDYKINYSQPLSPKTR